MKIETEEQYDKAIIEVDKLFDVKYKEGSQEAKYFLDLCNAIGDYEDIHYPMGELCLDQLFSA